MSARRSQKKSPITPTRPRRRIYAVGDIHGCVDDLLSLWRLIEADAAKARAAQKLIVYLGDYVDRGPDSRAVINLLATEPRRGFDSIHLKGNHEDAMLRFLEDDAIAPLWLAYGGAATLLSYGIRPPIDADDQREIARAQRELSKALPPGHLAFLRSLPVCHEVGDYFFVHAGVRPGVALSEQSDRDMLWIRDEFLRSNDDFGKIVVHGHNITAQPDVRKNRIGIDTGAFATGRLTCLVIDGAEHSFLAT